MLKVSNLTKSFGGDYVLNNLSLMLEAGGVYALMGANGSGKTTLFNLIGGFISIDAGTIDFQGKTLNECSPYQIALMGISRTFQDLRVLSKLTVEENLYLALRNKPDERLLYALFGRSWKRTDRMKVRCMLEKVHLSNVGNQKAGNVSYGQQKLLTVGMALINDFELLLLDEPVAGVQPRYRDEIAELLIGVDKTVVFIEHNPDFIQCVTDKVIFLDGGSVIAEGDYSTIREIPKVQQAYL